MADTIQTSGNKVKTKPKLGFLGVGWIGRSRMDAIFESGLADIRAVCDSSQNVAEQACEKLSGTPIHSNYEELLHSDIDGVVIATPSAQHAEQAIRALEMGKSVFVQKPLARTAADTKRVLDSAREKDLLIKVDFSYRHTRAIQHMKELVDSGEIGEIYAADLVFHNAYGPDKDWYYDSRKAGGGCMADLGIHLIDLLYMFSPDAECSSLCSSLFHNGKNLSNINDFVEDYAVAQINLSNGISAQLSCSWNLHAGRNAVIAATFYGNQGGLTFQNMNGSFYDFEARLLKGTKSKLLDSPPDNWGGKAAVAWVEQLSRNRGYDDAGNTYLKVAQTLDWIYERG